MFAQSGTKIERQLGQFFFKSLVVRVVGVVVEVLHLQQVVAHEYLVLQKQAEGLAGKVLQYVHAPEGQEHQQAEVRDVPRLVGKRASLLAAEEVILDFQNAVGHLVLFDGREEDVVVAGRFAVVGVVHPIVFMDFLQFRNKALDIVNDGHQPLLISDGLCQDSRSHRQT